MKTVRIDTILKTIESSCDFGPVRNYCRRGLSTDEARTQFWKDVISNKAADSGFGHLVDNILENGWHPDSAVGWDGERINEGHHRLVAAILLGMDEVPVTDFGQSAYGEDGDVIVVAHNFDYPYPAKPIEVEV